jgi:hypothetical protein
MNFKLEEKGEQKLVVNKPKQTLYYLDREKF